MTPQPQDRIDWLVVVVWASLAAGVVLVAVVACAALALLGWVLPRVLAWALAVVGANPWLLAAGVLAAVVAVWRLARRHPSW